MLNKMNLTLTIGLLRPKKPFYTSNIGFNNNLASTCASRKQKSNPYLCDQKEITRGV